MANKSALINVVYQALTRASRRLLRDFGEIENLQLSPNSITDFVTKTEIYITNSLTEDLLKSRPTWKFKSTNSNETESPEDDTYYWIIDPLNGKVNFSHGLPNFAISIAVEKNSEIIAAVIMDPLRDELFFAEKGKGAFLNDRRIRVSKRTKLNNCLFSKDDELLGTNNIENEKLSKIIYNLSKKKSIILRHFGSPALNLAWLASGKIDCFLGSRLSLNEIACGKIIIKEAGGYMTNFKSSHKLSLLNNEIIAASPSIHGEVLKEMKEIEKIKL